MTFRIIREPDFEVQARKPHFNSAEVEK